MENAFSSVEIILTPDADSIRRWGVAPRFIPELSRRNSIAILVRKDISPGEANTNAL